MYEIQKDRLGKMCKSTGSPIKSRSAEWKDAKRPMAASSTHDGQWVANSTQSATGKRERKSCTETHMEGVRTSRSSNIGFEEKPCQQERLVSLGHTPSRRRQSVHPEIQAELVVAPKPNGDINTNNVLQLLEHQRYRCALSGQKLTPQTAALDHIVPIRCNGEHIIENAQVLHKDVNRAKGSLTNDEFIQLCHEVVLLHKQMTNPRTSENLSDAGSKEETAVPVVTY